MLLLDLIKLFSTNFDINEERFVDIIQSNNIKLSQRLLVAIKDDKKITTIDTNINSNKINITPVNEAIINNPDNDDSYANLKKKRNQVDADVVALERQKK